MPALESEVIGMARLFYQRHYKAVASVIADQGLCGTDRMDSREAAKQQASLAVLEGITDRFIALFEGDSSRFDAERFQKACGWGE